MRSKLALAILVTSIVLPAMAGCGGRGPTMPGSASRGTKIGAKEALKPVTRPTATPSPKPSGTANQPSYGYSTPYGAPAVPADTSEFGNRLRDLGYAAETAGATPYTTQVAHFVRMPAARFTWASELAVEPTYQRRKASFGANAPTFDQWRNDGLAIARKETGVTYYVARRGFYKDVLSDRARELGGDAALIVYKRLAGTNQFVSFRMDGRLDDYGIFPADDWRELSPVPTQLAL